MGQEFTRRRGSVAGLEAFGLGGTVYGGTKFAVAAIPEGLRHEAGDKIRATVIMPGTIDTELKSGTSGPASREFVTAFYEQAVLLQSIARAIRYAIEQPADVDVNQIVIRPTA